MCDCEWCPQWQVCEVKLHTYNINARAGRNTALITLAGELPAAVLADALGLTTNTAVDWVARARRDWATYVAQRAEDGPHTVA